MSPFDSSSTTYRRAPARRVSDGVDQIHSRPRPTGVTRSKSCLGKPLAACIAEPKRLTKPGFSPVFQGFVLFVSSFESVGRVPQISAALSNKSAKDKSGPESLETARDYRILNQACLCNPLGLDIRQISQGPVLGPSPWSGAVAFAPPMNFHNTPGQNNEQQETDSYYDRNYCWRWYRRTDHGPHPA